MPVNLELRVIPANALLILRRVVMGGLVEKICRVAGHQKAMSTAHLHPQLIMVFTAQLDRDILPKGC